MTQLSGSTMDGLTTAYHLERRTVSPAQLLLDPTNPRLITDSAEYRHYSPQEIQSSETQSTVLMRVCQKEHGVQQLIASIEEMGFIGGIHEMIVKRIAPERYMVIEGNRRTAALQHLLREQSRLRHEVKDSIRQIEVQELIYRRNDHYSEAEVIDILMGTFNLEGPKEWGALERAHYVLRAYERDHSAMYRGPFRYRPDVAKQVGARFKMTNQAVQRCLLISRVYDQLRRGGYPVQPQHFSLVDLAVKTRSLANAFFEVDDLTCQMSTSGLERFAELCLEAQPPVHNPKLFQTFAFIYAEGTELEVSKARSGEEDLEELKRAIDERRKRREFSDDLDNVLELLGALRVFKFRGTAHEREQIRRIERIVARTLVPLANQ
jgi:hypothetical protein